MADTLSTNNTLQLNNTSVNTTYELIDPTLQSSSPLLLNGSSSTVAASSSRGLGGISGNISYTGTAARVIDSDLTITNIDSLNGARVLIGNNFDANRDRLGIDGLTSGIDNRGVAWKYNESTGVLTLDSTNALNSDIYQDLLRRVTYTNTDPNNSGPARTIQFSLGNALTNPQNQNDYQFVTDVGIAWTAAKDKAAQTQDSFGRLGYLATITSQQEQEFIQSKVEGNGWIGASDAAVEGEWRWVTGPEGKEDGGKGRLFWQGTGAEYYKDNKPGTGPVGNNYNNWDKIESLDKYEPNDRDNNEDYAHIVGSDNAGTKYKWNDLPDNRDYSDVPEYQPQGYIVEFDKDPSLNISASVTLSFGGAVGAGGTTTTRILWRNYGTNPSSSGLNRIWSVNYDSTNTNNPLSLDTDPKLTKLIEPEKALNWEVVGSYDVDKNGINDIFWRNYKTGENAVWFMKLDPNNGIERDLTRTQFLTQEVNVDWKIEGVTNFDNTTNGFGILWRHNTTGETAIWGYNFNGAIDGTGALSRDTNRTKFIIATPINSDWKVEGWADFNNDNVADILWRNNRTGENAIWKLNGNASGTNYFTEGYFIKQEPDANWQVADVIDFDKDGVADILWRNNTTGENAIWGMQSGGGINPAKTDFIFKVPETEWFIEGIADFTGDGVPDLLWRNYKTGENAIWRMKGDSGRFVRDQGFFLPSEDDFGWEVEDPNPTTDRHIV